MFGEHGGLTSTLDLTSGSPAIDAGNSSAALPTDQRGVARDGVCDIGAYEYTWSAPQIVSSSVSVNDLGFSCSVQTVTGATYFLDFKSSLTQASWTVIGQGMAGDGSLKVLMDPAPTTPAGFYRVRVR